MNVPPGGICRAWCKDDGLAFRFDPACYPALKAAWLSGAAFFAGRDIYGAELIVKLAAVEAITWATEDQVAEADADAEAQRILDGEPEA